MVPRPGNYLEQLRRSRSAITGVLTKIEIRNKAIDSLDKAEIPKIDIHYLEALQERLEKKLEDAQLLNSAILVKCRDDDVAVQKEITTAEQFDEKIQKNDLKHPRAI